VKPIGGHTQVFAVLGHPIRHTLSPAMHNAAFAALGLEAVYLAFDVAPERLLTVLEAAAAMGFGGVNLTVPLKETAFGGLRDLDDSSRALGAVNTVRFLPDGMRGYNTDGTGFVEAVGEAFGTSMHGLKVFVLGCGGAGRAVAVTCAVQGAARVALADADAPRVEKLAAAIAAVAPRTPLEIAGAGPATWIQAARAADVIVQATPVGMRADDRSPLPPDGFRGGHLAFDLVYNVPETDFMRCARSAGARAANGLGMLLHQGAASFTIWTGRPAPVDVMRRTLESALYGRSG
jgi:shikimate dehydrogenase